MKKYFFFLTIWQQLKRISITKFIEKSKKVLKYLFPFKFYFILKYCFIKFFSTFFNFPLRKYKIVGSRKFKKFKKKTSFQGNFEILRLVDCVLSTTFLVLKKQHRPTF